MLDEKSFGMLRDAIASQVQSDRAVLDDLRSDVRRHLSDVRQIRPRSASAISIVAADGGNNQLRFDPFLVQLVRVVDSSHNQYCLEAVSPTMKLADLNARQFKDGAPATALGQMMRDLGVDDLSDLSHYMVKDDTTRNPRSSGRVHAYRELVEWSILYAVIKKDYGSDTLIVFDGLLRSIVFAGDRFARLLDLMEREIARHARDRRRVYLVGFAKSTKVFTRYQLAMKIEGILRTSYPAYVEVPGALEEAAYAWSEYARGDEQAGNGRGSRLAGGKMHFVKFGDRPGDPIWPVDIFAPQLQDADTVFGYLLNDAVNGFPVNLYPRSLQQAHESAALVQFDREVLQDQIFQSVRQSLGEQASALDEFQLEDDQPAQGRYG